VHGRRDFRGGPAAAAGIGRRGHDYVETILRPVTAAVVMSVDGDWHESPAQLQVLIIYRRQQARPGDA
jgi:hypothetical protein